MFLKPTSSYLENGGTIEIPHPLDSLHHEVELAVVIGHKARDVPERLAMDYIGGTLNTQTHLSALRFLMVIKVCDDSCVCRFGMYSCL